MSSINILSNIEDCREMVDYLLDKDNKNLIVYYHEFGPVTTLRYKGFHFYLKYNKDYFARITQSEFIGNPLDAKKTLFELGGLVSQFIGDPLSYYDMSFMENGVNKMNPTLEWCLNDTIQKDYILSMINDSLFDDGTKCLNIQIFDNNTFDYYKDNKVLYLKK